MKCVIPEISWHNRDPVLSIDIQPRAEGSDIYRLASGGTDSHVLIWHLTETETGTVHLEIAADLTRHQRAVNVVRWSPSGKYLASGDDESAIFVWKMKSATETRDIFDATEDQDKETWLTMKVLRGHMEDVYDLAWSPDSTQLISGSVDNTAIVWDVMKGKSLAILSDHKSFVQGVAWDPKNQYLATLSTDRSMRLFDVSTRKVVTRSSKSTLPVSEDSPLHGKVFRIFHDDTLQTFYRRLCFSPDGELLIAPSGVAELNQDAKPIHTTYVYTRNNTKQPSIVLPSPDQYSIAVRCCPLLFELRDHDDETPPVIELPYRMIFAVATKSSVYLYDTQQPMPIGLISNIHYTRLTDLAWSNDGRILIVSSTDGFCTMITFAVDELGTTYKAEAVDDADQPSITDADDLDQSICISSDDGDDGDVEMVSIEPQSVDGIDKVQANLTIDAPTPIAFRRKPREKIVDANESVINSVENLATLKITESVEPALIEIRKKPSSPKIANIETDPPGVNHVAIRRTPRNPENAKPAELIQPKDLVAEVKPTPIAFRRKPRTPKPADTSPTRKSPSSVKPEAIIPIPFNLEIPTVIISTNDKFESPGNRNGPVTPIQFRREPRNVTPNGISPIVATPEVSRFKGQFPVEKEKNEETTPKSSKTAKPLSTSKKLKTPASVAKNTTNKATPIAVRRHHRNILPSVHTVERSATEEEAVDAWPIDQPRPMTIRSTSIPTGLVVEPSPITPALNENVAPPCGAAVMDIDNTEDIRLVYEDESQQETEAIDTLLSPMKENLEATMRTPDPKTPRRVELRTISTPKSKKKLL